MSGDVLQQYKDHLQTTSQATTSFGTTLKSLGATIVNMAANMAIMFAVSKVISVMYELSQVSDTVAQKAADLGGEFKTTESDISSYKDRIEELYKTINDGSSSLEEVTTARQNLMSVQDELIDKFGTEKDTIDIVTDAIYGQADALDRLTQKQWQETLNSFNDGSWVNDIANGMYGYSNNIERMLDEYGNYSARLNVSDSHGKWNTDEAKEIVKQLQEAGADLSYSIAENQDTVPILELNGTASEVYEKLLHIQEIFSDQNPLSTEHFRNELTKLTNSAKDMSTQYEDMYNKYILYEKIFKDDTYAESFKEITDAYNNYQDAFASGDDKAIDEATENFSNILSAATDGLSDQSVIDYFNDMYPSLEAIVDRWEFKTKVIPTFDTEQLQGKTQSDVLDMLQTDGLQDGEEIFNSILNGAKEYGIITDNDSESIQRLLDLLSEWGILQKNISNDAPETIAPITKTDAIAKVNEMSEGFESLDKIMSSIKDKNPFDYALLDDKKFKENFQGCEKAYVDFIETISSSPKDISACQSAFDGLVTAFLDQQHVTEVLNDDTKDLVVSMLENMGVTNASTIVQQELTAQKFANAVASTDMSNATSDEINALLEECGATGDAADAFASYAVEKLVAQAFLDVSGDITALANIVNSLGLATDAWRRYYATKAQMDLVAEKVAKGEYVTTPHSAGGSLTVEEYQAQLSDNAARDLKNFAQELENNAKTATYGGGAKTNKPSSGSKSKKEKEPKSKDFDWISRRQELLQKLHDKEMENANDETLSYQTRIGLIDNLIAKDKERLAFNEEAAASYTKTWEDAKAKILEEAAKQGVDGNAIIASIMNGDIENQTITDKNSDYHLVDSVQAAVDTYDDLVAGQEKSDEINKELNDHLKKQLELKLSIAQAQTDIASAEAASLDAEIKLMEATGKAVTEKQLRKQISLSEDLAETYYDQIDALEDQLSEVEDGSAEYYSLQSQISQCEASIADCAAQQAELNDQIKRLPIERINKFLELLGFFKENLQNFIDQQNALGKATTLSQFEELGKINTKQLEKLAEQQKLLSGLLKDYEFGSTKYQDTVSDLQDIDNEISSLIQNQYDWNKAILQLPIDQLSKAGDVLQNAVTAMSEILADYDSAISAVTGTLDKQIKAINDLKDATTDEYESKIKPLQDELDTLQKQNEARKIQLDLEKAQAALDLANQQKTNKVNKIAYFYSNVKYASSYIG